MLDAPAPKQRLQIPLLLFGVVMVLSAVAGIAMLDIGLLLARVVFGWSPPGWIRSVEDVAWAVATVGLVLGVLDWKFLYPVRREKRRVEYDQPSNRRLTVVLTAYNDEQSIGPSVKDFLSHPLVARVIVVDNNSVDRTSSAAAEAGAEVVVERAPGYGRCVYRALSEGLGRHDTEMTLLCEGDMTFRAHDIDKFLAFIAHVEIVNGTRIVEQLRERQTQLSAFMYYGNFFMGKLLEVKHLGRGTFTDVGTTYKLCRNSALTKLLPKLDPSVNLEFNAHLMDRALASGIRVVECPITFHARMGKSKGGNVNNLRALRVGVRMFVGLLLSWRLVRTRTSSTSHETPSDSTRPQGGGRGGDDPT